MFYCGLSTQLSARMATRGRIVGVILGWIVVLAAFAAAWVAYHGTRLSRAVEGFPRMPFYGAVAWWFFLFFIPMLGLTYGALFEWGRRRKER
jgi:hypothetical protein